MDTDLTCRLTLRLPFPSEKQAQIVYNSLRVDKDPKSETATRSFSLEKDHLVIEVKARNAKHLRVSVTSLFDFILLSCRTIQRFGPAIEAVH